MKLDVLGNKSFRESHDFWAILFDLIADRRYPEIARQGKDRELWPKNRERTEKNLFIRTSYGGLTACYVLVLSLLPLVLTGCGGLSARDLAMENWWTENIPRQISSRDTNRNGYSDTDDLIAGGRLEVKRKPRYHSAYYPGGGYPPAREGVCTDLVWRAYRQAGYDLKSMIDMDIHARTAAYPRVGGQPDPDIDFRRVPNLQVFFQRHGRSLTTVIRPGDALNLAQWQPGDLVTFKQRDHIAIVSTRRNRQGVPYLIHNPGPRPVESDDLWRLYKNGRLTGHYRFPKD